MKDFFEFNKWEYQAELSSSGKLKFEIKPENIQIPPLVIHKYYGLTDNSIKAFINHYLYASHPFQLNDPFDCFDSLISYDSVSLEMFLNVSRLVQITKEQLSYLYTNDKPQFIKLFKTLYYDFTYSKIGVISMTEDDLNILMWAYYTNQRGFLISFDTKLLSNLFYGPFPINYVSSAKSIAISKNPFISALYQTNIKSDFWKVEKEWRFLAESKEGIKVPHKELPGIIKDRTFEYPLNAVKNITFGYLFFEPKECYRIDNSDYYYNIDNKYKIKLLNEVIKRKIETFWIYQINNLEFKLTKRPVRIEKIDNKKYMLRQNMHVA